MPSLKRLAEYLVIWVPLLLSAGHIVVFSVWTAWMSFTPSTLMPENDIHVIPVNSCLA